MVKMKLKRNIFLSLCLFFSSAIVSNTSYGAGIIFPVFEASQIITPMVVPAVSVYKVTNITGSSGRLETSPLPWNVIFDPNYVHSDGTPSCRLFGQTLADKESCMIKFNISGAVATQPFFIRIGLLGGNVDINVVSIPAPGRSLSFTPALINLSPGRAVDLFVSNPIPNFVANNVQVMLPAPLAERIAKVAYFGCDGIVTGGVCKITFLAKADIAIPVVGWVRVVGSNTLTTVPIQIGASK
jgi:hypothetical protein